jgi:2'-5' RNA ligase
MRLFVAIDLDEAARAAVGEEQKRLMRRAGRDKSIRWARPEQMHVTLVFVGHVDAARGAEIRAAMNDPIAVAPFAMVFARLGVFPPHGAPTVLWLGVGEGERQAVDVQRRVAERLERCGVPRERRPFHPHLTLARWRTARPSDRRIVEADSGVVVATVNVPSVTLYESRLSSAGSTYTALTRAPLQT